MDNLEVASFESFKYDKNVTGESVHVNVEDNMCCFLTEFDNLVICEYTDNVKTFFLQDNISKTAVQVKYLSLWHVVFIATRSNLLIYEPKNDQLRVVHSFITKITTTSWNPNETFLVVVDEKNQMYGFNFEINTTLDQYHFIEAHSSHLDGAVPNSVYVGWGSHNTQFKGVKKKDDQKLEDIDQPYSPPVISWRGNGEQFVINFWKNNRRFLKVFDSGLRSLFQSETYPNLLAPTSFKGQGNFIACAARQSEKNEIVIFEKNCLVKSEFSVPENMGEIKYLQYHRDMHILAVYSEDLSSDGHLNIYLNSNAKWYLKQQLYYPPSNKLKSFHWTNFLDKTMCTLNVLTSASIERILFRVIINRYPEDSLIAVIDGVTVHFTKFSEKIIPPPMFSVSLEFEKPINNIYFDPSLNLYQFRTSHNNIHSYIYENGEFKPPSADIDLPQLNLDVNNSSSGIIYNIKKTINNIHYEFVLDRQQDLLINESIVCTNVLSMYIHEKYLLFTHASCNLYCIRLTPKNLVNLQWKLYKLYSREIEQGAKIVCVTSNYDIIIELPRGNLETVTCRVIAIDYIEKLLSQNKWKEAIYKIRRQRLNWNLLIDLNLERFCDHIGEFVDAAETVAVLGTIVSEFSNENCLETIYSGCIDDDIVFFDSDKTKVFTQILNHMVFINPIRNLVSIVTLQIKHFTLKSALQSVCTVFEMGELEMCKKAVFQILLHSFVNNVISEAYTLYNINFMTFIYSCCSEDPRVFEPELAKLQLLDPIHLRFNMNVLGKHFRSATKYLVRCRNFDEKYISDFITKHGTQSVAYENVAPNHSCFKLVTQLFAKHLALKGRHNEAGLILERGSLYEEALKEYKRALNWQQVLTLLDILKIEDHSRKELLLSLANDLVNQKKIDEAVLIYRYNCAAYEKAIEVLIEQRMYQKALSLARQYKYTDVIENMIKPAIVKYRTDLYDRITDLGNMFLRYTARLQIVRQQKLHSLKFKYLDEGDGFETDDIYSEYGSIISSRRSSAGSASSKGSTTSSKNLRKQEKKKTDLREGGIYEDIALIRHLYLLANDIFGYGREVQEVSLTLTDDESFKYCTMLHDKLSRVQDIVRSNIPKIWSNTFLSAEDSVELEIFAIVQNKKELDVEFRNPPSSEKMGDKWKLLIFSKE